MNNHIKAFISYMVRILSSVFYLFPIKTNRILFRCNRKTSYSCNPMYISEYLMKNYPGKFEVIWAFKNPDKFKFLQERGIKICKGTSIKYLYYVATSKVYIFNHGTGLYEVLKKNQLRIFTLHAGAFYKRQKSINTDSYYRKIVKRVGRKTSLIPSSCELSNKRIQKDYCYKGEFLNVGMPRNDMLINNADARIIAKVRTHYSIPEGVSILLYAPTYRKVFESEVAYTKLDLEQTLSALKERFGGAWIALSRTHPASYAKQENIIKGANCKNASDYPDMQELLLASDVLITDYSSSIWDFSLMYKPCFLYAPDLNEYEAGRGFDVPLRSHGFSACETNDELSSAILAFDEKAYKKIVENHHKELGLYETGRATESVCKRIYEVCYK